MPWKECNAVSERLKFVARLEDGERMSDLCQEFGISRKTGYKLYQRYQHEGTSAFSNQSRKPHRCPHKTPQLVVDWITKLRRRHPSWGAPKIHSYLCKKHPAAKIPVPSTIHCILDRNGLIEAKTRRQRFKAEGTQLSTATAANDLWCADFKGQFRLGNRNYCYPLTITDQFSRYILCIDAQDSTAEQQALYSFERTFSKYGLPQAIRTDNGVPFSTIGLLGLSKLSVWWLRLGIRIERIKPGQPQQNGRHERMHLTLKQATTRPPAANLLRQQEVFDDFVECFNHERPHDGLQKRCPAQVYAKSLRAYPKLLAEPSYEDCDEILQVSQCGSIRLPKSRRVHLAQALGSQPVGLKRLDSGLWSVHFMTYELGYFDELSFKFTPKENPFLQT